MKTQLHVSRLDTSMMLQPDFFLKIRNDTQLNKPGGGLWTSTYIDDEIGSAWVQAAIDMGMYSTEEINAYLVEPSPSARIYVVDGLKDMYHLWDEYSYKPFDDRRKIDFEKLAESYDAIHLTANGQAKTRIPGLGAVFFKDTDYDPTRSISETLYGWDCECTIWFRWVFDRVSYIGPKVYSSHYDSHE